MSYFKMDELVRNFDSEEEGGDLDQEEGFPNSDLGSILFSEITKKYDISESDVKHGDALDFNDYRGVGLWIVEEYTDRNNKTVKKLHKTYGEMGYMIPIQFSDAPRKYFERLDMGIEERLVYPPVVPKDSQIGKLVQKEIIKIRKNPVFEGETEYDNGKKRIDLDLFPSHYVLLYCEDAHTWRKLNEVLDEDYVNAKEVNDFIKRKKDGWNSFVHLAFLYSRLIGKKNKIPKGVCNMIAEFIISFHEDPFLN